MSARRTRFVLSVLLIALAAGCGSGEAGRKGGLGPPLVAAEPAATMRFVETIEAVGTGLANEQVTLSAPVTERILRLGFDDGSFVRAGQTIAVLAQGEETARLAEAQARAREAGQQLERVSALKERGFATKANLDAQQAAASAARAQAAQARATIGDRIITAPFSGWVSLRNISPGAIVTAGTEIATISDLSRIKLDFPVPETALSAIRPGLPIVAHSAAFPEQPFRGQIANIDTLVDPATRAVKVRAHLPNPDGKLKPGMLLTVAIETASRTSVSVPELAVIGQGDSRFVYVLGKDGTVKRTEVRTGLRSDGRIEIVEGLRPGQPIISEGVAKLSDGMKVKLAGAPARAAKERQTAKGL